MAPSYFEVIFLTFILFLPFLYESSQTFRYYFKFVVYYGVMMVNSIILLPVIIFRPGDVQNFLLASAISSCISRVLGLKWELRGLQNMKREKSCIIVANHQSSIDVLGMFDIWPSMNKCTVVAKKELFYAWPLGLAAWLCGLIFIDRMNSDRARTELNMATDRTKKENIKLWIFPEGTRRNDGEFHPFKKGAFHAAINAQIDILPVVFSSYYFLSHSEKRFDIGNVIITTLPPISTEGLTSDDVESLMAKTRTAMSEVFHATNHKLQQSFAPRKSTVH